MAYAYLEIPGKRVLSIQDAKELEDVKQLYKLFMHVDVPYASYMYLYKHAFSVCGIDTKPGIYTHGQLKDMIKKKMYQHALAYAIHAKTRVIGYRNQCMAYVQPYVARVAHYKNNAYAFLGKVRCKLVSLAYVPISYLYKVNLQESIATIDDVAHVHNEGLFGDTDSEVEGASNYNMSPVPIPSPMPPLYPPVTLPPLPAGYSEKCMLNIMEGYGGYVPEACFTHIDADTNILFFEKPHLSSGFPITWRKKQLTLFESVDMTQYNAVCKLPNIKAKYDEAGKIHIVKFDKTGEDSAWNVVCIPEHLYAYLGKLKQYGLEDINILDVVTFPKVDFDDAYALSVLKYEKNKDMNAYLENMYHIRKQYVQKVTYGTYLKIILQFMYNNYECIVRDGAKGVLIKDAFYAFQNHCSTTFDYIVKFQIDYENFVAILEYFGYTLTEDTIKHISVIPETSEKRNVVKLKIHRNHDLDVMRIRQHYWNKMNVSIRNSPLIPQHANISPWNQSVMPQFT